MQSTSTVVQGPAIPPSLLAAMTPMVERFASGIRNDAEKDRLVLPSVPDVLIEVRKALNDPDGDVEVVCRCVSRDPALAARLLRVANSPTFAGLSPCDTVQAAVVRLGSAVVDNVMLMFVVSRVFSVGKRARIQPHLARLWAHSTRVAALSHALAGCVPHLKRDTAMLAGLIHDIGAVPLIVRAQEIPSILDNRLILDHVLATLHGEMGALVLERWNAPAELIEVVLGHEDTRRDADGPATYTDLVLVANLLSHAEALDPETTAPIWELPASRKLGIDTAALHDLMDDAAEREAEFSACLGGG